MHSFKPAITLLLFGILAGPVTAAQGVQTSGTRTNALTNKDVLGMLQAGLSQEIVIAKIKSSACNLDTSPTTLRELKAAHVPKKVILAMVQAPAVASPSSMESRTGGVASGSAGGTPPPPPKAPTRIRLDGQVQAAKIIAQPQPIYPPLARQAGIHGNVVLHAIIQKDGRVDELQVISGHPLLVQSALDAVKNWRYQPLQLNGDLVEVDTTITVTFVLSNAGSGQIQNIAPEEIWKRVTQCVLPTYPGLAFNAHVAGTVDIGLGISPDGDVANTSRVLDGPPLLVQSGMDAIRQWTFRPNIVQGAGTWSRVRALVRFNPDGTTAVDLAPAILADNFGDPGTPSSSAAAIPRPESSPDCKAVNEPAQGPQPNQQPAYVPAATNTSSQPSPTSLDASPGSGPRFVDGAYMSGTGGIGRPICASCPQPSYSDQARDKKISGTVILHLIVTSEGRAANVQVRRSLGYGLDEKAVEAIQAWRFNPAVGAAGKPVPVWADIEVDFRLK